MSESEDTISDPSQLAANTPLATSEDLFESVSLETRFELANQARIDWTIHLHKEIHLYLRSAQALQQIAISASAGAIGVAIKSPSARAIILIASPFVYGSLILAFITYIREVLVAAGFIEFYERALARDLRRQVLVTEQVLGSHPPNREGVIAVEVCLYLLFIVTATVSVYAAWAINPIAGYAVDLPAIVALGAACAVSYRGMRNARLRVVREAEVQAAVMPPIRTITTAQTRQAASDGPE